MRSCGVGTISRSPGIRRFRYPPGIAERIAARTSWTDLALAFSAATLLFALPLYVRILVDPGSLVLVRLIATVQVAPTIILAVLAAVIRRVAGSGGAEVYWSLVTAAGALSVLRLIQLEFLSTALFGLVWWQKALVASAVALPLLMAIVFARRWLIWASRQVAPAAALTTLVFLAQIVMSGPGGGGPSEDPPRRTDTVVIVVFDELGRDVISEGAQVDAERFPNFASVAADGAWFLDATTNYGATCIAIPSMLTGRYINEIDCKDTALADLDPSLLSSLAAEYRVSIYEEVMRDCRDGRSAYVCRGSQYFVARYPHLALAAHLLPPTIRPPFLSGLVGGSHTPFAFRIWEEFLSEIAEGDEGGQAYFVHIAIPHAPYIFDEHGELHGSPFDSFTTRPEDEPAAYANYERQSRLADRLFGDLLEVLRVRGLYETATIVVTGDHGPWGPPTPEGAISRLTPRVPLIMKGPSVPRGTVSAEYQHIDLAPTLTDVLGLPGMGAADGRSAFGSDLRPRERRFILADHVTNPFRSKDVITYVQKPGEDEWQATR